MLGTLELDIFCIFDNILNMFRKVINTSKGKNFMNRDNHAGKMDMYSWIGGFFDGEGFITLRHTFVSASNCYVYQPVVIFTNTDKKALEIIKKWLDEHGCKCGFSSRKQHFKNPTKWKPTYDVSMYGIKRVKNFIELIGDYTIIKKPQINLIKKFIDHRLSGNQRKKYGKIEQDILEKVKGLKHNFI